MITQSIYMQKLSSFMFNINILYWVRLILPKMVQFSSVQLLSHVRLFAIPWTAAHQASLSITNSRSLLTLMPIESVMPSTSSSSVIPFSSRLQSFPASGSFPMSQFFPSGGQNIGVSASASVLPMNIQDWSPLGWTGLILQSKGFSRVFPCNECVYYSLLLFWMCLFNVKNVKKKSGEGNKINVHICLYIKKMQKNF